LNSAANKEIEHRVSLDCESRDAGKNRESATNSGIGYFHFAARKHARDQIFQRVVVPQNFGPGQQAAGQVGFQRLDQSSLLFGLKILLDCRRASPRLCMPAASYFMLLKIENRAKGFRVAAARGKTGKR
jgi:hypothetical protein